MGVSPSLKKFAASVASPLFDTLGRFPLKFYSMASLGQELKRERELRGISLKEIADSTRIGLKYLQAIEDDQLQIIPGTFFIRAILRSYARTVGLDEDQVLNRYQELQSYEQESSEPRPNQKRMPRLASSRRRVLILGSGVVLILFALLLSMVLRSPQQKPEPLGPLPASISGSSPPPTLGVPPTQPSQEVRTALDLEMTFIEETWLQVFANGTLAFEGIKKQGDSLHFSDAREITLNLGNAGGFAFFLNGKKGKPFGPPGAVRKDIRITLDNYSKFLLPEEGNETPGR